jgi:outer membrane protein assembly factor BamB
MPQSVIAISSDGGLHPLYVSDGEDPSAQPFLPANAAARDLTVVDNVAYVSTSGSCSGVPNGIWALDLVAKQSAHWMPPSGDIAGGFAFGPDSTLYAGASNGDLVALSPRKLEASGVYRAGAPLSANPVVFEYKTKPVIAAPTQDGKIHLVDPAGMTGVSFPAATSGALASWQDSAGVRWIIAPSKNAIAGWKIDGDSPALAAGWTSAMQSPLGILVDNGVVFAVSNSPNAVLHALDGATGKEIWSSGKTMTAPVHIGGLSESGSQIYIGTSDGFIYAFTFPIEH